MEKIVNMIPTNIVTNLLLAFFSIRRIKQQDLNF